MPDAKDIIDINDPILQQEMVEADPDADFFEQPPPPPDDREYQFKLGLGEGGVTVKHQERKGDSNGQRTGPLFLNFNLEVRVVDPGQPWDNMPTQDYATSIVMQSSGTSKLHSILRAVGAPALGRMDLAALRDHALGVFASEPLCFGQGQWEARAKDGDGSYRTVRRGMKNFPLVDPQHPELGHSPWIEDAVHVDAKTRAQVGTGEIVRAYFRVNKYFAR